MPPIKGYPGIVEIMKLWTNGEGFKEGQEHSLTVYEIGDKIGVECSKNTLTDKEKAAHLYSTLARVSRKFFNDFGLVFGGCRFAKNEPLRYLIAKSGEEYHAICERIHIRKENLADKEKEIHKVIHLKKLPLTTDKAERMLLLETLGMKRGRNKKAK